MFAVITPNRLPSREAAYINDDSYRKERQIINSAYRDKMGKRRNIRHTLRYNPLPELITCEITISLANLFQHIEAGLSNAKGIMMEGRYVRYSTRISNISTVPSYHMIGDELFIMLKIEAIPDPGPKPESMHIQAPIEPALAVDAGAVSTFPSEEVALSETQLTMQLKQPNES